MKKIITYGTFDLFHQGHFNLLKRAKEMGDYLIVGITGADYDMQRGKINVQNTLVERIQNVRDTGLADEIIVEEYEGQKINDILKYNVDILVLGSDWRGKFDYLTEYCEVVYLERTKNISSTALREKYQPFRLGIIADKEIMCKHYIDEVRFVTGIHYQCIFNDDEEKAKSFYKQFYFDEYFSDFEKFCESINIAIVYVKGEEELFIISKLLNYKIHVISNFLFLLNSERLQELYQCASENNVLLCEDLRICYLQEFERLLSIVKSKKIGRLISIKARINQKDIFDCNLIQYIITFILMITKLFLPKIEKESFCSTGEQEGEVLYGLDLFKSDGVFAQLEYGSRVVEKSDLTIVGSDGIVSIPEQWWNLTYYKLINLNENSVKRYSSNYEGNGFRYVLKEVLNMITNKDQENIKLSYEDIDKVIRILSK